MKQIFIFSTLAKNLVMYALPDPGGPIKITLSLPFFRISDITSDCDLVRFFSIPQTYKYSII